VYLVSLNQVFTDCCFVVVIVVARLKSGVVSLGPLQGSSAGIWDFLPPPHTRFEFDLPIAVCFLARFRFRRAHTTKATTIDHETILYFCAEKTKINKILPTTVFGSDIGVEGPKISDQIVKRGELSGHIFGYSNQSSIKKIGNKAAGKNVNFILCVLRFRRIRKCYKKDVFNLICMWGKGSVAY